MHERVEKFSPQWNAWPVMVFGGQFDTHIKTGEEYDAHSLGSLFAMEPTQKPKGAGPAFIPSSYNEYDGREHAVQRMHGSFVALCGDVDSGDHAIDRIEALVRGFAGDAAWLIYSSAHARPSDMRWRIVMPLDKPLSFYDWYDAQHSFFQFMEAAGVEMDRALDRAAQPVYLPNVPELHGKTGEALRDFAEAPLFYQRSTTGTDAPGLRLDSRHLASGMSALRRKRADDDLERERIRQEAERKRAASPRGDGASLMDDFNAANSVATMLEMYGYTQSPRHTDDWRSTYQTGDSYATRVIGSKWVSLSASDTSARLGQPCSSGCYGDAYDLYVHYEHGGDHKAAYRALGREARASTNNVIYPEQFEPPEWMRETPPHDEMPEWCQMDATEVDTAESASAPPQSDTYELLSLTELENMPAPAWLVREVVSEDGLTIIYGDPGAGKSFVALDMALRVASGVDWHGIPTKQVGVLYIAGEGARGIGKRVTGWRMTHKAELEGVPFMLLPMAVQLMEPTELAKLLRTIDEAKRRCDFDIGLTVIDTVSRSIAGKDENGQETMSAFVSACDAIKNHTGGATIGIHHSGKDKEKGMRGSTVLLGACDAAMRLTKEDGVVTLKCEKQKDAEEMEPLYMRLNKIAWPDEHSDDPNAEQSTLVPERTGAPSPEDLPREAIRQAFAMMADAWGDGRPLSNKPQTKRDGRFAPAIFSGKFGGEASTWDRHLSSWLESGCISIEVTDKRSKVSGLRVLNAVL